MMLEILMLVSFDQWSSILRGIWRSMFLNIPLKMSFDGSALLTWGFGFLFNFYIYSKIDG